MLLQAVMWMNLALIFYTWAVFSGRKQGLHRKHLIIFGIGLLFDYLGTRQMNLIALAYGKAPEWHNITGIASLGGDGLSFSAGAVCFTGQQDRGGQPRLPSCRLSIYSCWLIAFFSGAISGMLRMKQ